MEPVTLAHVRASGTQAWPLNNTALKSIRDSNEDPPGFPNNGVDLFHIDPFLIKTLHRSKGMDYELKYPLQPWSWRGMLNGMAVPTLERIVGDGITGICCMPIRGSYDHKRRHAAKQLGRPYADAAPVPIWDFVVTRTDGTAVRFHTNQTDNKVSIMDVMDAFETEGPAKGKGESDGPGTYKRMVASSYHEKGYKANEVAEDNGGMEDATAVAVGTEDKFCLANENNKVRPKGKGKGQYSLEWPEGYQQASMSAWTLSL